MRIGPLRSRCCALAYLNVAPLRLSLALDARDAPLQAVGEGHLDPGPCRHTFAMSTRLRVLEAMGDVRLAMRKPSGSAILQRVDEEC
jgi:hypothetical protein